jgi:hypothetical protein
VIRQVAEAGWQPVTAAACDNPAIWVERFGADSAGVRYYTLYTDAPQAQSGVLSEDVAAGPATNAVATELLSGALLPRSGGGWKVQVASQSVAVVRVEPGPRFRSAELAPGQQVRLAIESPLRLTQILEAAPDFTAWQPILTNTPLESPFAVSLPWSAASRAQFYRLRF